MAPTPRCASKLYKAEKDLANAQERLLVFQQTNNVNFLQEQGSSAASYLAKLNVRLADLRTEFQLVELVLSDTNAAGAAKLPSAGGDAQQFGGYLKAREQHLLLKAEREDLGRFLRPKHPKILKMDEEIARQERTLDIFKQQTTDQLASTRNSLGTPVGQPPRLDQGVGSQGRRVEPQDGRVRTN